MDLQPEREFVDEQVLAQDFVIAQFEVGDGHDYQVFAAGFAKMTVAAVGAGEAPAQGYARGLAGLLLDDAVFEAELGVL